MAIINSETLVKHDFSDIKNAIMPFNAMADMYGEDLAAEQLRLEHESYVWGEERFNKALERQIEREEFAETQTAKPLMQVVVPAVAAAVVEFVNLKQRGRPHVAKAPLSAIPAETATFLAVKTSLMTLAKYESCDIQRLANTIGQNIEDEIRFGRIRDEEAAHFKNRVKENLNKRNGLLYKRAYMEAVEAGMMEKGELTSTHEAWEPDTRMHVGIRMIEMIISASGLLTIERKFAGIPDKDHQAVHIADAFLTQLTTRAHALSGISPLYQPTVVPPKPWTGTTGGGYWAKGRKPLRLIRTGSKKALERYNDVEMPQVYHAVNLIQNTAWSINQKVLEVANQIVNWDACPIEDIPSKNKAEKPKATDEEAANPELLKKWKKKAAAIYRKEKARQSRRLSLEFTMEQANKFAEYEAIWFPHNLDWRGRVYAVPMFNPQGNDITKGLLRFAEGMPIGEEGAYWLAVHGANTAGVDKVSLDDRVKWVADNEAMILASAENPLDCTWWAGQDSAFCFLAFCFEWADYVKSGRSVNFVSHLALAFDGTCSGLQHFSAMLRDEIGGAAVNLLPADKPQDVYGIVAIGVNKILNDHLLNGTDDAMELLTDKKTGDVTERLKLGTRTLATQWLQYGVTRSVTKRSVMTLAYGSKEYGFADQVREDTVQPAIDSGKGEMFTEPSQACRYMAKLIWDVVGQTVVAAVEAMSWLQKAATLVSTEVKDKKTKEVLKPAMPVRWTTPAGFQVWSAYRVPKKKRIDCILFGELHLQITMNVAETPELDARKQAAGIAPNFVHSMDASHLKLTVVKCHDVYGIRSFAMIHDSFGCHAGNAHLMFKGVREVMVETYENNDVIAQFYNEFADMLHESQLEKMPAVPAKGNLDLQEILKSLYTFS